MEILAAQQNKTPRTPAGYRQPDGAAPQPTDAVNLSARAVKPEVEAACRQAESLLQKNDLAGATTLLNRTLAQDTTARTPALLGVALFRSEKYGEAAQALAVAHERQPDDAHVAELLELSRTNELTNIRVDVSLNPFDKNVLLGAPQPGPGFTPPAAFASTSAAEKTVHTLGVVGKAVSTAVAYGLGGTIGMAIAGLSRAFGQAEKNEIWTTWSRKSYVKGMMMLSQMRKNLNKNNLVDTYPEGKLTGFVEPGMQAPEWTKWARTADGTWNNALNPKEGAAGTRFGRNVALDATVPDMENLMSPNPREISRVLLTREGEMKKVEFLNLLAAAWIQFMVHDWVSHGDADSTSLHEVPLKPDDPIREKFHMTHMLVPSTAADPTRQPEEAGTAPTYVNEVTHWWDGSQIYGSDLKTQHNLRSHSDGKMRLGANGNLPVDKNGVEETGVRRNWWLGLSLLHNLFVHEHNSICDMLKSKHPGWDDERLFQTARLINAAVMAKIHTVEWTPAILPNDKLVNGMLDNWYGAAEKWLNKPGERKSAHMHSMNEVTGGVVGNRTDKHGVPYALTEEFDAVYRHLHSLLPDAIHLSKIGDEANGVDVPLAKTRMKASHQITDSMSQADLLNSFGTQHPGQLTLNNYPKTLQDLSVPGFAKFDLATIDVIRERERGVPRYNEFRRQIGLVPITKFEDLTDDKESVAKLKSIYGEDVEKLDLIIGCLGEGHRPDNFGFGETIFQIFILNATRRLQADRFFTESYNAETYTQEGLDWIDNTTMKDVLLRHNPSLAQTGLPNVPNAFGPWDKGQLDPARHPLTQVKRY